MIAEKVSGEPLMRYLKRKIFDPLGMKSVVSQDDATGPRFAAGYGRYALGPLRVEPPAARGWLYAAGELSMTAEDLAKWNIARINRSLIPTDDWQAQETPVKLDDGKDTGYGLGVGIRPGPPRAISHTGESVGFLASNVVYPDQRAAIVVLTNSWSGGAYSRIARDVAKLVLPQPAQDPVQVAQATRARSILDQLRSGRLDRTQLTENANYYFKPRAIADFHSSLAPLGAPTSFEASGTPTPRGGFVAQSYVIKYPAKTLRLSTFYEPGPNGRIEQFLITAAE
jgi:CubicO group peptidase (beta-lactamase class C family)